MSTRARPIVAVIVFVLLLAVGVVFVRGATPASRAFADGHIATVHVFNDKGELVGPVAMKVVAKTPDQWRETLTPAQFHILPYKAAAYRP